VDYFHDRSTSSKCALIRDDLYYLFVSQMITRSAVSQHRSVSQHAPALLSVRGLICQQYIVWVKIIYFSLMPKIIRILRSCSMKILPTVNISLSLVFPVFPRLWESCLLNISEYLSCPRRCCSSADVSLSLGGASKQSFLSSNH